MSAIIETLDSALRYMLETENQSCAVVRLVAKRSFVQSTFRKSDIIMAADVLNVDQWATLLDRFGIVDVANLDVLLSFSLRGNVVVLNSFDPELGQTES